MARKLQLPKLNKRPLIMLMKIKRGMWMSSIQYIINTKFVSLFSSYLAFLLNLPFYLLFSIFTLCLVSHFVTFSLVCSVTFCPYDYDWFHHKRLHSTIPTTVERSSTLQYLVLVFYACTSVIFIVMNVLSSTLLQHFTHIIPKDILFHFLSFSRFLSLWMFLIRIKYIADRMCNVYSECSTSSLCSISNWIYIKALLVFEAIKLEWWDAILHIIFFSFQVQFYTISPILMLEQKTETHCHQMIGWFISHTPL